MTNQTQEDFNDLCRYCYCNIKDRFATDWERVKATLHRQAERSGLDTLFLENLGN